MIVKLKENVSLEKARELAPQMNAILVPENGSYLLVSSGGQTVIPEEVEAFVKNHFVFTDDIQLASRKFRSATRSINISSMPEIGGNTSNTLMITGPCSVETLSQIESAAKLCVELGVRVLRAGAFKPRTSPYSFQGLGSAGLQLLQKMRELYGLKIISEVRDSTHVQEVIEAVDIIQVGAKAMYDQGILRACARSGKPVLIKRGFGTTLQEFVQAAEFVLSGGNDQVMLCERGIRTFETKTRFTLDLCGVAWLKEHINLPVILDPSHAIGHAYGVADLARACMAMGVDGLLIETHPDPAHALSDASQQLDFPQFRKLFQSLGPVAASVNRKLI